MVAAAVFCLCICCPYLCAWNGRQFRRRFLHVQHNLGRMPNPLSSFWLSFAPLSRRLRWYNHVMFDVCLFLFRFFFFSPPPPRTPPPSRKRAIPVFVFFPLPPPLSSYWEETRCFRILIYFSREKRPLIGGLLRHSKFRLSSPKML